MGAASVLALSVRATIRGAMVWGNMVYLDLRMSIERGKVGRNEFRDERGVRRNQGMQCLLYSYIRLAGRGANPMMAPAKVCRLLHSSHQVVLTTSSGATPLTGPLC